jgi:hypothetical protein
MRAGHQFYHHKQFFLLEFFEPIQLVRFQLKLKHWAAKK